MKYIPLTQGYVAMVDDEDYERVAQFKWHAKVTKTPHQVLIYARRNETTETGKQKSISMHRFIVGVGDRHVDHKDTNGLNNQRYNLRKASESQNGGNRRKGIASSVYKGVRLDKRTGRWEAKVRKSGVLHYLGMFKDEVDAATAYNFKAFELFEEFARLNIPIAKGDK